MCAIGDEGEGEGKRQRERERERQRDMEEERGAVWFKSDISGTEDIGKVYM